MPVLVAVMVMMVVVVMVIAVGVMMIVIVSMIVVVVVLTVLVMAVAGGARMRVAHNPEGASKTASQHIGNRQRVAAATRSQGDPGLDE